MTFKEILIMLKEFLILGVLIILWALILFNPVIISYVKETPVWLFLYVLFPVEVLVGLSITKLLGELL